MSRIYSVVRKVLAVAISLPLFVLGLILIPLPGPGLLICFLAFVVLSFGFDGAKKYRDNIFSRIKSIFTEASSKNRPDGD